MKDNIKFLFGHIVFAVLWISFWTWITFTYSEGPIGHWLRCVYYKHINPPSISVSTGDPKNMDEYFYSSMPVSNLLKHYPGLATSTLARITGDFPGPTNWPSIKVDDRVYPIEKVDYDQIRGVVWDTNTGKPTLHLQTTNPPSYEQVWPLHRDTNLSVLTDPRTGETNPPLRFVSYPPPDVYETNKGVVTLWGLNRKIVQIGFRDDGVVVWMEKK